MKASRFRSSITILQRLLPIAAVVVMLATNGPVAHAGGFDRVNTVFENINNVLIGAGVAIMTMSLLWCGYKIMFRGASFEDMSKPLIGGIILGAAPTLAGFLLA